MSSNKLTTTWATREIWMTGEAYFDVKHVQSTGSAAPQQFKVHVGPLTVEVLGTTFNIRQRRDKIEVALVNGSVKLTSKLGNRVIYMSPGDLIRIDTLTQEFSAIKTNTESITSWTQRKLTLTNPTLQEICLYLEDNYGKKIVFADPQLASKRVEGPILLDSFEDALFILTTVLNLTIIEENNTLILRKN